MYGLHCLGSASANTSVPRGTHAHVGTHDAKSSSRGEGVCGEVCPIGVEKAELPDADVPAVTEPSLGSACGVILALPTTRRRSTSRPASLSGEPPPGEGVGPGASATRSPSIPVVN